MMLTFCGNMAHLSLQLEMANGAQYCRHIAQGPNYSHMHPEEKYLQVLSYTGKQWRAILIFFLFLSTDGDYTLC